MKTRTNTQKLIDAWPLFLLLLGLILFQRFTASKRSDDVVERMLKLQDEMQRGSQATDFTQGLSNIYSGR